MGVAARERQQREDAGPVVHEPTAKLASSGCFTTCPRTDSVKRQAHDAGGSPTAANNSLPDFHPQNQGAGCCF